MCTNSVQGCISVHVYRQCARLHPRTWIPTVCKAVSAHMLTDSVQGCISIHAYQLCARLYQCACLPTVCKAVSVFVTTDSVQGCIRVHVWFSFWIQSLATVWPQACLTLNSWQASGLSRLRAEAIGLCNQAQLKNRITKQEIREICRMHSGRINYGIIFGEEY